jgi:hypothetical protein
MLETSVVDALETCGKSSKGDNFVGKSKKKFSFTQLPDGSCDARLSAFRRLDKRSRFITVDDCALTPARHVQITRGALRKSCSL